MSAREDIWAARLHAAVDDHPGALAFDVHTYVAAGRTRARRRRATALAATAAMVAVVATVAALAVNGIDERALQPATPIVSSTRALAPDTNGWVAVGAEGEDVYLVRPGQEARRVEVTGWDTALEACPTWSPDGTRLLFGRLAESEQGSEVAELVVVPVESDGATSAPRIIPLPGFSSLRGFDPHPCGTWAPDGRWVALKGLDDVWVVDTHSETIRRIPNLRPLDLEWRPGTDQLAIAGDIGPNREAELLFTPVSIYSVSTGELGRLGSVEAGEITWSPDGTTMAYTGGDPTAPQLRLVGAGGGDDRLLLADPGTSLHGIGPVWSPAGDRIVYQRSCCGSGEGSEVVLVNVADGTLRVIEPPRTDGPDGPLRWYPFFVTWSPEGTTLLYAAWSQLRIGQPDYQRLLAVPADRPGDATEIPFTHASVTGYSEHRWVQVHMWARQPG